MAAATESEPEPTPCYRYDGVFLDPTAHRLQVDGRDRACSRRALALLHLLCQRPGRVWTRSELLDALWPGGQVVADESLSQLVFRLRAALGRHAERIVTVRGVGVRLDAEVTRLPAEAVPTPPLAPSMPIELHKDADTTPPALLPDLGLGTSSPTAACDPIAPIESGTGEAPLATSRLPMSFVITILLFAVVLLAVGVVLLGELDPSGAPDAIIDEGFALRTSDIHAQRPDTARLLREALQHDDRSDRERAQALMEVLLDSDPGTPVPALILALWSTGIGDAEAADHWIGLAAERIGSAGSDPYLLQFERYVRAERGGNASEIVRHAGALLDLRPQAWRLRLARAHLYGYMGLRDQALTELQQIRIERLDHSRQAMALGDRASFGDVDGALRILDTLESDPENANEAFVRGRIAWSAGEHGPAREHLLRASELARRSAQLGLRDRALAYAGVLSLLDGDTVAALAHFERARAGASERRIGNLEIDLSLLLAHVHRERGDDESTRLELERARSKAERLTTSTLAFATVLVATRLAPELEPAITPPADVPGATALLKARHALAAGDADRAGVYAGQAVAQGAMDAWLAEETRLLLAELGLHVPVGPPLDPPHPPLVRYAVRRIADRAMMEPRQEAHSTD